MIDKENIDKEKSNKNKEAIVNRVKTYHTERTRKPFKTKLPRLKVIPLGGLQEIGKNMTAFEFGNEIIVVDCGIAFPEDDMLGIDLVIPDFSYLTKNIDKLKAVIITHGHEDHIGALPYFLKKLNFPVYATRLTIGLIQTKLKEHNILSKATLINVEAGDVIKASPSFKVEYIRVTHSIADSCALAITTPVGVVIHSGDFKIDHTPIQGKPMDLQRFAELGKRGVLLFLCESTNVQSKGFTMSERNVGLILEEIFKESETQRIMIATFSSNIDRIQQIINSAIKHNRKVSIIGRSMNNVVKTASELGYLQIPDDILIDISMIKNYTDDQIVIIMTGSQGETMSALYRISQGEHKMVEIKPNDKVIISASPIPGNEKSVYNVINDLLRKGADVVYDGLKEVHVSGHARQEEIKILHALVRPKFFMPIHGEFKHLKAHCELAVDMGIRQENTFIMNIGDILEVSRNFAKKSGTVPSGKVLIDGLGVGDVGHIVLRDRKILSQDGLMVVVVSMEKESALLVSGPDIVSRGFVYVRESEYLIKEAKRVVREKLLELESDPESIKEWGLVKNLIRDTLKNFIWQKTKRNPMILPVIMEV